MGGLQCAHPACTDHELDYAMLSDIFPTAYSAQIKGAAQVFVVDQQPDRLELAKQIGAVAVDRRTGDAVEQVTELTGGGADRGVDAVGYQAHDTDGDEHPIVLNELVQAVKPTGGIGVVGVYLPEDPGAADEPGQAGQAGVRLRHVLLQGPVHGYRTGQRQGLQPPAP